MNISKNIPWVKIIVLIIILLVLGIFLCLDFSSKNTNANVVDAEEGPFPEEGCVDSDGGINYAELGKTHGVADSLVPEDYIDVCLSSASLKEFYCDDDFVGNVIYNCSIDRKICLEGRCFDELESPEPVLCVDSDGLNYTKASSVYGQLVPEGAAVIKHDSCNSTDDLIEYSCGEDNIIKQELVPCWKYLNGSVCSSGACILNNSINSANSSFELNCTSAENLCVDNFSMCVGNIVNFSCSGSQICCEENSTLDSSFSGGDFESGSADSQNNLGDFPEIPEDESSQTSYADCGPGEDCTVSSASLSQKDKSYWWLWLIGAFIVIGVFVFLFFMFKERFISKKPLVKKPVEDIYYPVKSQINQSKVGQPQINNSQTRPIRRNPRTRLFRSGFR